MDLCNGPVARCAAGGEVLAITGYYPAASERDISKIVTAIRDLFMGRSNAMGEFTLTPAATSTVVVAMNCGEQSRISITPQTANAAAALATTYIVQSEVVPGQFTVRHASDAQVDKTFSYSIRG